MRTLRTTILSRPIALAGTTLVALTLVACGGSDEPAATATVAAQSSPVATATAQVSAFPMTLQHKLGSVELKSAPERVVVLGPNDLDILVALEVTPIAAVRSANNQTGVSSWLEGKVDPVKTELITASPLDLEKIASLQPDLIVASSWASVEQEYARLSAIAPTLAFEKALLEDTWQERTLLVGKALGIEAKARNVIAETEAAVTAFKTRYPWTEGRTYSLAWARETSQIAVIAGDNLTTRFLAEIGLSVAPSLAEFVASGLASAANSISLEQVRELDADYTLIAYGSPDLRASVEASTLFQQLQSVIGDRYQEITVETIAGFRIPTVMNVPWLLEQIEPVISRSGS